MPSTVIAAISYQAGTQVLEITFLSGAVYRYFRVPEEVYQAFKRARSKGKYFNRLIRERYEFTQVAP